VATLVQPVIVYTNFGPGMTFDADPFHGWAINGSLGPNVAQQAVSDLFIPTENYSFSGASVALASFVGPARVRVFLQADSGGRPGAIIEEFAISGLQFTPTIFPVTSSLLPSLRRGTRYWLTVTPGADGVVAGWNWNSIGDNTPGTLATTSSGSRLGPWGIVPLLRTVIEIRGNPPTPALALQLLVDNLDALAAQRVLNPNQANALIAKLSAASASLRSDRLEAMCGQLVAFANQLRAFVRSGDLSEQLAQGLLESARALAIQVACTE
jgi:hypothetical protein